MEDEGVDGVMLVLPPPLMTTAAEVVGALLPILHAASKPAVVALMGEDLIVNAARLLRQARIPDYRFPECAAAALGVLWQRAQQLRTIEAGPPRVNGVEPSSARQVLASASVGSAGFLDGRSASRLASAYGLGVPDEVLAGSSDEAIAAAERMGGPIALKIASPDLPHKTDVGGVRLNLEGKEAVERAYGEMVAAARLAAPEARVLGVIVRPMAGEGREVIVGAVRDAQFGPLVMFGGGGVEVESMRDVSFALAPLSVPEAESMLDSTAAGRRLSGTSGGPPVDRQAAAEAILRVSQLIVDHPAIAEVEVNPLRVMEAGAGALALDVWVRVSTDKENAAWASDGARDRVGQV